MKMRKILALIIALTMCISVFPTRIFAVDYNGVEFTALDGTGEDGADKNYTMLLDGKKTENNFSKWCDKVGGTYIPYIIFKASQKVIITDYTFITGNDNESWTGRNPKDWVLYGCNDYDEANKSGGTWDAIHTVTNDNEMQDENFASYKFTIENNNKMYQYYKLVITANHGANWDLMQLSEMELNWDVAYYVTFDKNGGETEADPQTIKSGNGLPTTNPTRNGYKFLGWYIIKSTDDSIEYMPFTKEMSDAATEDMTVYADWEIATITFNSNNSEVEEKPNQLSYGEIPETNPTMAGFTFDGWYTENGMSTGDWGEKYPEEAIISADTTVYAKWIATDKDCLANVTLTALSGTAGVSGESYDKLVDGKKTSASGDFSKWCVTSFKGAEIILKASAYTIPVGYTLTTGNDNMAYPGRNPKDWVLYGCNDYDENKKTGTWTEIDKVTDDATLEDKDFKSYGFTIENTKAYRYFKFEILSIKGTDVMQLAEFELKGEGCEHTFGEPEIIEPTCTTPGKTEYRCLKCDVPVVINYTEAPGHTLGENGTCSVCGEICAAKVGDMYYFDLQKAIDEALALDTDKTVTLLNDFDITDTITIGKGQVTLDLNGHTINMTDSGSVIKLTDSNSNFVLDDSSTEKTGTITNSSTDTEYGGGIYIVAGTMTMNGGTIKACTAKYGGGIYKSSGELKIAGGTITECKATGHSQSRGGGIFNNNGKLEIADGTISKCSADGWFSGGGQPVCRRRRHL